MQHTGLNVHNSTKNPIEQGPVESISALGKSVAQNSVKSITEIGLGIGSGLIDTLTGLHLEKKSPQPAVEQQYNLRKGEVKTLYNFQQEQEIRAIKELTKRIHEEVMAMKKLNASIASEVKDIEKVTINSLPEKPGIYHVRFLEIILSVLVTLRAKVNESYTWLHALNSKKQKRGSAFAALSKKKGTSFSQSQELTASRSVQ